MKNLSIKLAVFLAVLFSAATLAAPGHYIVVTLDDSGKATPVFYRSVNFSRERSMTNLALKTTPHDADHLLVTGAGWSEVAEVPRFVRGEFAANGMDGPIKAYQVEMAERSFALRIPSNAGTRIKLEYMGIKSELDVQQVATNASRLALANTEVKSPKAFVNSANRVDILVLGDGYTSAEQSLFNSDAENLRAAMFDYSPYKQYANMVNWTTTFNASSQSGADHPPYLAGCTSASCCADTAAQSDPKAAGAGTFVNTAFDGKFCTSQIHRLVTINSSKIYTAASAFPDWDQLVVILNDAVYGGSGGSIAVTTTNTNAKLIVIHEYGHTFHNLADEYSSPYPGYPACSDINGPSCRANVTDQTVPSLIKWKSWIGPTTPIPTPAGTAGIGLFEGAQYLATGMYRPANTCGMRNLGAQFCSICSQAYILKLYRGGFGTPSAGIDLIEPGSEIPSAAGGVIYNVGNVLNFSATVLRPSPDTVTMQWYLDGVAVNGATSSNFNFQQVASTPGSRTLELRVTDNSPLVKAEMAGSDMVHSRTWNITVATPLSLSINDASITEGNSGVRHANFTVNLSGPAPVSGVSFDIATTALASNGNAALPGRDFSAAQYAGKIIPAGQSSATFSVKVIGDKVAEPNEVFGIRLSNPLTATISDDLAVGIIVNDDFDSLRGRSNSPGVGGVANHSSGGAAVECLSLQKEIVNIETKVAANRQNETDGLQRILQLETKRSQLGCR